MSAATTRAPRTLTPSTLRAYAQPAALAIVTAVALVLALLVDGAVDLLATALLAFPLLLVLGFVLASAVRHLARARRARRRV